jgi:hypothetical protein
MRAPVDGFPVLTVGCYRLRFVARSSGSIPEWAGSTWRGAFGRALKQSVCVTGIKDCAPCPLFERCTHAGIFETPPTAGQGKMRKYTSAPRPYVLLPGPGGQIETGEHLDLEVRLFGSANDHRELVTRALERAAWKGLGKARVSLELHGEVESQINTLDTTPGKDLRVSGNDLVIRLLTPLRMRIRDHYVGPAELTFGDFFSVLLRRLSMLCTFHEKRPFEVDFKGLVEQARNTDWRRADLELVRLKRYSSRQKSRVDMSGLTGTLGLAAGDAEPFLPWLWLGQHTLLGRGCVMGLGRYKMDQ